jgi:hypothetical protein
MTRRFEVSDTLDLLGRSIEREHGDLPASTRRRFVTGAAATIGSMGLLGVLTDAAKANGSGQNSTETILTVAATAEVLATIVNTVGWKRGLGGDAVTQRNIKAAAREELVHYNVLASLGAKPATTRIWVPNAVFANRNGLLNTLQVGDQIFVNAYLIATKHFGDAGNGQYAAITAEFMGVEAVHRALARQSLGQLGNDRVFMKYQQKETAPGAPNMGQPGFTNILTAVSQLEAAGFGFGKQGAKPGAFFDFDTVKASTPTDPDLNTFTPSVG